MRSHRTTIKQKPPNSRKCTITGERTPYFIELTSYLKPNPTSSPSSAHYFRKTHIFLTLRKCPPAYYKVTLYTLCLIHYITQPNYPFFKSLLLLFVYVVTPSSYSTPFHLASPNPNQNLITLPKFPTTRCSSTRPGPSTPRQSEVIGHWKSPHYCHSGSWEPTLASLPYHSPWRIIALNGVMYEPSRRLVLRMDLLPDSENLFIQKIGFGGFVYGQNKHLDDLNLLSITDLENKGMQFVLDGGI